MKEQQTASLWAEHTGPLKGVRVLDVTSVIAGPFAGALLADFGAEVIKIEQPITGDASRNMGPFAEGESLRFPALNRNKKGMTLDLRHPRGAELFLRLCREADIVLENFRPGTLEKWGLGTDRLRQVNSNLIVIRISGYGQYGPYRDKAGFGTPATAFAGLTYLMGYQDRPPLNLPISMADLLAGMYGAMAALLSLYWRDANDGSGQDADISLYESVFRLLEDLVADYSVTNRVRERRGGFKDSSCPAGTFCTKDGKWVVLVCSTDRTFNRLAQAMGRTELQDDSRYGTNAERLKCRDEVDAMVSSWIAAHHWEDLSRICSEHGVPMDPICTVADIFADPQYQARESIIRVDHPRFGEIAMPGLFPKLSRSPGKIVHTGPDIGMHNDAVLSGLLGLSEDSVAELRKEGVI